MEENMEKKKNIVYLIITYIGALASCLGVILFGQYVMMSLPLVGRMVSMLTTYWLIAVVPFIIMKISKMNLETIGFVKEKKGTQIIIGIVSGLVIASAYFLVPYFLGFGELVDNGDRYNALWQFAFEFVYFTFAVGAVEEIVFRGVIYQQLMNILGKEWGTIIVSSVLFGLFHIFNGNIIQVIMTTIIGFLFCVVRYKIKKCSMLSMIFMHGTYDFMLLLFSSLLM